MSTIGKLTLRLQLDVTTSKESGIAFAKVTFHALSLRCGSCLVREEVDHCMDKGPGYQSFFRKQGDASRCFFSNCLRGHLGLKSPLLPQRKAVERIVPWNQAVDTCEVNSVSLQAR